MPNNKVCEEIQKFVETRYVADPLVGPTVLKDKMKKPDKDKQMEALKL